MQELVNTVIAHYAIIEHLATGGMSNVYLAKDLFTEQVVALKLVPTGKQDFCQRFQREAYTVSSLHHEHILPALDYGESDCWCYLAMPYIPDGTLRELLQEGPLSLERAGLYLDQIASALHYAHQQGIIHRDIKASNFLLREGDGVFLADFGLVKSMDNVAESLTETGFMVGTAEYMAPELAEENATRFSDIYALGIVVYQMLTGDVPFKGITPMGTFMQHLSKQPCPPSQMNPNLPAAFDSVILRALDKQPERRYQSALEFAQAYRQALANVMAAPTTGTTKINLSATKSIIDLAPQKHKRSRNKVLTAIALLICLFLLLGVSTSMFHGTAHNLGNSLSQYTIHSSLPSITASPAAPRPDPMPKADTPTSSTHTTGQTSSIPVNTRPISGAQLTPVSTITQAAGNPPSANQNQNNNKDKKTNSGNKGKGNGKAKGHNK